MAFFFIFDIDEDIIQIYNNKNIKLFRKNLINIALENCQSDNQPIGYYLILKIAISDLKNDFLLISFANSHLVIGTYEVELDKPPSLL